MKASSEAGEIGEIANSASEGPEEAPESEDPVDMREDLWKGFGRA